jgi:menaquinone-9 beta-reductase
MVLTSDGLMGSALGAAEEETDVDDDSFIGVSAVLEKNASHARSGIIYMACGRDGYVGLVRREDERLEVAAALDPGYMRAAGTARACAILFEQAGFKVPSGLDTADWKGTPPLTRSSQMLSGPRFFVLGDAAGYVEPFTGEGIYWAFLQARALTSLLAALRFEWYEDLQHEWPSLYGKLMAKRRRACRAMTRLIGMPAVRRAVVSGLHYMPWLASPMVHSIHGRPSMRDAA